MEKRSGRQQKYYFSDKLKGQLAQIPYHPLTIVEAPSGFGKTTAIREYLKGNLQQGSSEYWYTCLGEPSQAAWMGICDLFSHVSGKVADSLRNINMPTMDTLFQMISHLRDVQCPSETYLVVDNYHLVNCEIPRELIDVFSMHGNPRLHMIIITQQLRSRQQISMHNNNIFTINASSFFFDREGTANLFRLEGIRLSDQESENVFLSTEGWISAIRLQILNYKETGSFASNADIEQLIERAIWNNLKPDEKEFLLSASILESFSFRQAAIMLNSEVLPENIEYLLKNNDFIKYLSDKKLFSIHGILQDYLQNLLYNQVPKEYQNQVFRNAGLSCAAMDEYCSASGYFYKIRDFNAILSLPFSNDYFYSRKEKYSVEFYITIINECPDEVLINYPHTMIVFGYLALMNGYLEEYNRLCRLISSVIKDDTAIGSEKTESIAGEYELLASLGEFNDINKMKEKQEKAWQLLAKPSEMIKTNAPYLFAAPSLLNMLWREPGGLESTLRDMEESDYTYRRLTRGNGAGAFYLLQSEALLMRGDDNDAEILCHRALYDARSHRQDGISICAETILARIAVLRGNAEDYFTAVNNIKDTVKENPDPHILRMSEYSLSGIGIILESKENVAQWLYDMESIKRVIYAPVVPMAQILHLKLLIMEGRYNEFYGICHFAADGRGGQDGGIKYTMLHLSRSILLAVAKRNNNDFFEARKYLGEALDMALKDKVYLPFAQYPDMEDFLFESACPEYMKGGIETLVDLCKRQKAGVNKIRKTILKEKSPLTPREREIALLAKERFSAKEIADKLYISEMTVRATLRNVYSKLDIHTKSELRGKEF